MKSLKDYIVEYKGKLDKFDEITRFRLYNSIFYALVTGMIVPILITLKGQYIIPWILSILIIAQNLAIKTNKYMVKKFTIPQMFKMGVVVHTLFSLTTLVYFISPKVMIYLDSIIGILETVVFSAFSIALNTYLAKNYPNDMDDFQIVRNSTWVDANLLGLAVISITLYFLPIKYGILLPVIANTLLISWMIVNWSYMEKNIINDK